MTPQSAGARSQFPSFTSCSHPNQPAMLCCISEGTQCLSFYQKKYLFIHYYRFTKVVRNTGQGAVWPTPQLEGRALPRERYLHKVNRYRIQFILNGAAIDRFLSLCLVPITSTRSRLRIGQGN